MSGALARPHKGEILVMSNLDSIDRGRTLRMGDVAPDFEARSTRGPIRLSDFRGRWLVFFSHPADFTPVCTSEFVSLAKAHDRFVALDCALLGLSVDSLYSHLAWMRAIRDVFDVEVRFPVVEDPSMVVGRTYGMIDEGATNTAGVRATYFIDPEGVIRAITHYPLTIGRSVDEILRMVAALQATYSGAKLAPADWRQKQPLLLPADEKVQQEANWFCRSEA
jgi:peroxiredoxin 2/4